MRSGEEFDRELIRVRLVWVGMIAFFLVLVVALWGIQVRDVSRYRSSMDRQSIRRVRLPATRGMILDKNGVCLADTRPSYCIAIYLEELWQAGILKNTVDEVDRIISRLEGILDLKRVVTRGDIISHLNKRRPLPFLAWRDVDERVIAKWVESNVNLPGVDIYVEPMRVYPHGSMASHVLGYVARAEPARDDVEPYHFYLPEVKGTYGLEKVLDELLKGTAGGQLIRVNVIGLKQQEEGGVLPTSGSDIVLTLDSRIQQLLEDLLAGEKGAGVVMDPRNGDILAMASSPSFDPNNFSPGLSDSDWKNLLGDPEKPLLNRVIQGVYPPGSIFKPVVAIAALESGMASENTSFNCPGYFALGDVFFRCWRAQGHGVIEMRKALEQSCNAYFCQLGLQCGYDNIFRTASSVGLGKVTGIELEGESGGILPDTKWNLKNFKVGWRKGDTCNISIGQGALGVTPLQMAVYVSAIANSGHVYRPRLVTRKLNVKERVAGKSGAVTSDKEKPVTGELVTDLNWSGSTMRVVRGGMYDVIQADHGTGKRAMLDDIPMGGKTGTAQYGVSEEGKKHAWMIVFAPFDAPRYAAVMMIEDAVSGGVTIAPRMKTLMEGIFELEKPIGNKTDESMNKNGNGVLTGSASVI